MEIHAALDTTQPLRQDCDPFQAMVTLHGCFEKPVLQLMLISSVSIRDIVFLGNKGYGFELGRGIRKGVITHMQKLDHRELALHAGMKTT